MGKEKDTQVTLRIPNEMKEKLQKISEENEETLSQVIRKAIKEYLNKE